MSQITTPPPTLCGIAFPPLLANLIADLDRSTEQHMQRLVMSPAPGERLQRFVGDRLRFSLRDAAGGPLPDGWSAMLRTNLGRAELLRSEILQAHTRRLPFAGASWRDLPMPRAGNEWFIELPLAEVGFFKSKAYALDPKGWQLWPDGPDFAV